MSEIEREIEKPETPATGELAGVPGSDFDHMTDAWVDGGQYCAQDVLDLRNEVRRLREIIGDVRLALENERDSFPILWKHSARLQAALRKCQNNNVEPAAPHASK